MKTTSSSPQREEQNFWIYETTDELVDMLTTPMRDAICKDLGKDQGKPAETTGLMYPFFNPYIIHQIFC